MLPGNPRYQPKELIPYFGYDNIYRYVAMVELANLEALGEIGVIPTADLNLLTKEIKEKLLAITTTEVDKVEREVTQHDIRAWVQIAQGILPAPLRRWVHVPLTSYDALDTARALQFKLAHQEVVNRKVHHLVIVLKKKVEETADLIQIGRTHGQHALPITVGFWLATILNRVLTNARWMDELAQHLTGKISGAVGAYNAQHGLGILDRAKAAGAKSYEGLVLGKLGLASGHISTQIVAPEPLVYYLSSATIMSGALAQLGRDCRQLMRSEIDEVREPFGDKQVGSSTMAHKRNPINFENTEGMYDRNMAELGKVYSTLVSEHQRDLVGSCVARDFPIIIVNLVQQLTTLLRQKGDQPCFLERIKVDEEACLSNFELRADAILAEPIYIILQMAGYQGDAHHLVNHRAMPLVETKGIPLLAAVERIGSEDRDVEEALGNIPSEIYRLLRRPEDYIGLSYQKAMEICERAQDYTSQGVANSIFNR